MLVTKHGVLLGILFVCGLLSEQIISKDLDSYLTVQINESEQRNNTNISLTVKPNVYPECSAITYCDKITWLDIARAKIKDDTFCQWRYRLSSSEIEQLLRLQYVYIVAALLQMDQLTDYGTYELWSLYKERCWKFWNVAKCDRELKQGLKEREKKREQQILQKKEDEKQQQLLIQKQKEQEIRNQQIYHNDLLSQSSLNLIQGSIISDYLSPYHNARKEALEKTCKDQYQKYEQCRELDAQIIGLCMAHNIDYQKLQQCVGTAMQHQLYDEVADCYKKIAKFFCQPTLGESILAQESLEFAQCVTHATELETMELAIALSDLAHGCTDLACWVVSESREALHDFVNNILDPIGSAYKVFEIAKSTGSALGKVMNFVAEAMVHADSESLGWSHYAQVLEQEHQYDAEYAQQIVDGIKSWVVHSSAQNKVRVGTRCIVDGILYGNLCKLLFRTGKAVCGLIADIPKLRFLGKVTNVSAEYGLATELGEVGLSSLEDLSISLLKSEINHFNKNSAKINAGIATGKKRVYTGAPYHHQNSRGGNYGGKSPAPKNGQKALDNSIPFKIKGNQGYERRLGVEGDYFVILDEHSPGEFHGHISTWKGLETKGNTEMQDALYKAGIVKNHRTGKK